MGSLTLPNRRRADLMGVDAKGHVVIVEIKVSRADLMSDGKWEEYLDYCDRYYWAVSPAIEPSLLESEGFRPDETGLVIADAYDAAIVRPAPTRALAAARRKVQVQMLARRAMLRLAMGQGWIDPDANSWD